MHCDYLSLQMLEIISQIYLTTVSFENVEEEEAKVNYQLFQLYRIEYKINAQELIPLKSNKILIINN